MTVQGPERPRKRWRLGCSLVVALVAALVLGGSALRRRWAEATAWRQALERELERRDAAGSEAQWVHEQLAATPDPAAEAILWGTGLVVALIVVAALVVITAGIVYLLRKP